MRHSPDDMIIFDCIYFKELFFTEVKSFHHPINCLLDRIDALVEGLRHAH